MSTDTSSTSSTLSVSGRGPTNLSRYSFIQQSENLVASKTRRAVRSHAMRAVRRQQRQESAESTRLKWPEQHSSGKRLRLAWPDEPSSDSGERQAALQLGERMQKGLQEGSLISSTSVLEGSESLRTSDEYDTQRVDFQGSIGPALEGASSLYSLERQNGSPHTALGVNKKATPSFTYPQTRLGAGRVDPFQTFPLHVSRSLAELIDHCMLPSHQFQRRQTTCSSMS